MDNLILYIYNFLLHFIFLLSLPILLLITPFVKRFKQGFWNYFGLPFLWQKNILEQIKKNNGKIYMIHGVSVGEIKLSQPIINKILTYDNNAYFVLTTTSPEAFETIKSISPIDKILPFYFPLDIPIFLKFFFNSINPIEIYILEVDIWPNFIIQATLKNIPIFVLNARFSDKTVKFYSKIPSFAKSLFSLIDFYFVQTTDDFNKALSIGIPSDYIAKVGNMKFDIAKLPLDQSKISQILDIIEKNFKTLSYNFILCLGSTHPNEEELVINALINAINKYKSNFSESKLKFLVIIAARNINRSYDIAKIIKNKQYINKILIFSTKQTENYYESINLNNTSINILIINEIGYLQNIYSISDIAYVGGSLSIKDVGGHNIIEPAIFGIPVIFGKNIRNFYDVAKILLNSQNIFMVSNQFEIEEIFLKMLNPIERKKIENNKEYLISLISENSCTIDRIFSILDIIKSNNKN